MSEFVSVIILAHNEAATIQGEIAAFYETITSRLPDSELIVAEDGSADGTRALIEEVQPRYGLRVVGSAARLGYSQAVRGAVESARGEFVFIGGAKHDPEDFWRLYERRHDADLVIGRKTNRTDQWYRRLLTFSFNVYLRALFDTELLDADSGMRLFNRRVIEEVFRKPMRFRNFSSAEVVVRSTSLGLRVLEVPISYRQREGESRGLPLKSIPRAIRRFLIDSWMLKQELRAPQKH